jgi:hypothetical protein
MIDIPSASELNIQAAYAELQGKTRTQIQIDTAKTWAARAIASYMLYMKYGHLGRLLDAEEYRHEALEHAAEAPPILSMISQSIDNVRSNIIRNGSVP